jgi:hypothetical protein
MIRLTAICILVLGMTLFSGADVLATREMSLSQNAGYWVGLSAPDAEKRYSMSNVFKGLPCVEGDRQMREHFYRSTGASRSLKVDVVCRGSKEDAERMRKGVIRAQGEPATSWNVPDAQ